MRLYAFLCQPHILSIEYIGKADFQTLSSLYIPIPLCMIQLEIHHSQIAIMASVSNLDSDVKKIRGDKVTRGAVNEVREFIEESIGERLKDVGNDDKGVFKISDALMDGVALCR